MAATKRVYDLLRDPFESNPLINWRGNVNGLPSMMTLVFANTDREVVLIERMIIYIEDLFMFSVTGYGGMSALDNGIDVVIVDVPSAEVIENLTADNPIQTNGDWSAQCRDSKYENFGPMGNALTANWRFTEDGGPLILDPKQALVVQINDDLTSLSRHEFRVRGIRTRQMRAREMALTGHSLHEWTRE